MKDSFINFDKFDELTQGNNAREIAVYARTAISDNIVGYSSSDRGWYIMAGRDFDERLMAIKAGEANLREQLFITEVINNENVRSRLFSAMGVDTEESADKLRELNHQVLKAKYKDLTGEHKNIKKEELVELLCAELKIEYTPVV